MKSVGVLAAFVVVASSGSCRCGRTADGGGANEADAATEPPVVETSGPKGEGGAGCGLFSAPIAAAHAADGEVLVAGLDVRAKAIRLLRVTKDDAVVGQGIAFDDVKWSSEADLKVVLASGGGAGVTWRGLRAGKMGRALIMVGPDLARKADPIEVAGASCATLDAIWFTDGRRAHARPWTGAPIDVDLPKDREASLVCGATRAFALLEEDEGTSFVALGAGADGGRTGAATLLREADFGEDEQRERTEYTVRDELGVVRLASSGTIVMREVNNDGVVGPLKKARTKIPHDDDVVAVDASPKAVVIVFTQDASAACADGHASTKVSAVRIDRTTGEETTAELSKGMCAREVGPFFTGAVGDGVSIAWVERVPVAGKPKAPIVSLAHAFIPPSGAAQTVKRIDVAADAVVDAGCDAERCYAAALERKAGTDGMLPGPIKVLRYR